MVMVSYSVVSGQTGSLIEGFVSISFGTKCPTRGISSGAVFGSIEIPIILSPTLEMTGNLLDRYWLLLLETVIVAFEVLLQKIWMRGLAPLEEIGSLSAKKDAYVCIVTGPTSGIGKETAKELHRRGWHVVLACRSRSRGERLAEEMSATSGKDRVQVEILDLSSLKSVRAFVNEWETRIQLPVHALINNAGVFSMSAPREETEDGFESHLGTNYLGHFLLTEMMRPWLQKAKQETGMPARVVNVSSKLHRMGHIDQKDPHLSKPGGFNSLKAYSQSKLAQVMFAKECNRRYDGVLHCVSVHPGEVLTDVVRSLPGAMQRLYKMIMRLFLLTPSQGMYVYTCQK
jgi:retinol dehydrogenase 12